MNFTKYGVFSFTLANIFIWGVCGAGQQNSSMGGVSLPCHPLFFTQRAGNSLRIACVLPESGDKLKGSGRLD